jgi:hypothetical protein
MEIKLVHPFLKNCHNINSLLEKTHKIATYCSKLEKQSILWPNRYEPDKYKGDGLELFAEALIKLSPFDNRVAIGNYVPVISDDTGVDGTGIGIDGDPATVQVKFRANTMTLLTANEDHLSNFVTASLIKYGVDPKTKTNMLIITTAEGLHYFTNNDMFQKKVRCLGYQQLRELVDNNLLFWNAFRELVKTGLNPY